MFWDRVAGVYDLFVNVVNRKTHKALRRIVADLIQPEDRVLECACGTGLLTEVIAGKCKAVTATDFAPKMLKRAEKNCAAFGNITFRQADITALDWPDGAFDKVVAGNVIHLLDEPIKAVKEGNGSRGDSAGSAAGGKRHLVRPGRPGPGIVPLSLPR